MDNLHLDKPHALTHAYPRHDGSTKELLIRPDSPDRLFVGIYTMTEKQARYSMVTLTPAEARQIASYLVQWADHMEGQGS